MKFSTSFFVLAATALQVAAVPTAEPEAAPVPAPAGELQKRDRNIYVCEGEYVSTSLRSSDFLLLMHGCFD